MFLFFVFRVSSPPLQVSKKQNFGASDGHSDPAPGSVGGVQREGSLWKRFGPEATVVVPSRTSSAGPELDPTGSYMSNTAP